MLRRYSAPTAPRRAALQVHVTCCEPSPQLFHELCNTATDLYRNPNLDRDGMVHIAVNNRGPAYDIRLPPDADVTVHSYAMAG